MQPVVACQSADDIVVVGYQMVETAQKYKDIEHSKNPQEVGLWMNEVGLTRAIALKKESLFVSLSISMRGSEFTLSMVGWKDQARIVVPDAVAQKIATCILGGYFKEENNPLNTGTKYFTCNTPEYEKYQEELKAMSHPLLELRKKFGDDKAGYQKAVEEFAGQIISLPPGVSKEDFIVLAMSVYEKLTKYV